uniref:transcription repressor KAN1-like n=1 Tax=Fragaria vesca subsp. vesca TaxID=101020 RepID=UPI0005C81032|nr:PREDICTED: transcription repressor KAN1-like [Fragaria vesca subsp. vesca]
MASTSNIVDLKLTLSLKPSWVPKSINNLLIEIAQINNASAKLSKLETYLRKHEEEMRRIQTFDRDHNLPHCMLLLKDAIEVIHEQISIIKNGKVEADHHTAPLIWKNRNQPEKPSFPPSKHDWVSMVRPSKWSKKEEPEGTSTNLRPNFNINVNDCSTASTPIVNNHVSPLPIEISRNGRRIWTPELHSRFMKAINDLGGAEAATPKLVKDRMRVDGLTNDQVKSHLQKLRIYKRAGLPIRQAGAGSSSADVDSFHQPAAAMASQGNSTLQSQVPYTRDFFGIISSTSPAHDSN